MSREEVERRLHGILEDLAQVEHERWTHWQAYVHEQGERRPDGSLVLPADLVKRWDEQIESPYQTLSETEKDSDRDQVRRYLPIIVNALSS